MRLRKKKLKLFWHVISFLYIKSYPRFRFMIPAIVSNSSNFLNEEHRDNFLRREMLVAITRGQFDLSSNWMKWKLFQRCIVSINVGNEWISSTIFFWMKKKIDSYFYIVDDRGNIRFCFIRDYSNLTRWHIVWHQYRWFISTIIYQINFSLSS